MVSGAAVGPARPRVSKAVSEGGLGRRPLGRFEAQVISHAHAAATAATAATAAFVPEVLLILQLPVACAADGKHSAGVRESAEESRVERGS
jgi:hypothetical protein